MNKMTKLKLGAFVTVLIFVVIFLIQNSLTLEVNFLFLSLLELSLVKLLLIFFIAGIFTGIYIAYSIVNWKNKIQEKKDSLELEIERV